MANFIQQIRVGGSVYDIHDSEFILDTRVTAGAAWSGVSKAPALFDGMQITFWIGYASAANVTLNLTLADNTTTGDIPVYYAGLIRMATQYGPGSIVKLTYRSGPTIGGVVQSAGWWADQEENAYRSAGIPYGEVDSTSTSTVFTATVPGITELRDGVCMLLRNGVVTSASGFTINVNGLGAKPSYSNMTLGNDITPTAPTRDTTIFNINYAMLFVYSTTAVSGGCWIGYRGYDANTNTIGYQLRTNSSTLVASAKFYRYRLLFTSADGTKWVPANTSTSTNATAQRDVNQTPIDPFGEIVWYGTTTVIEANAAVTAAQLWQQNAGSYTSIGYSFNRTNAAQTMTTNRPIYIKCAPQSDGSAIIDADDPYVQTLPSTEDGKIYIYLGRAYSATNFELQMNHPIYYYEDGAIRIWTNAAVPSIADMMPTTPIGSELDPLYWTGATFTATSESLVPVLTCDISSNLVLQGKLINFLSAADGPGILDYDDSTSFVAGLESDYTTKLTTIVSEQQGKFKLVAAAGELECDLDSIFYDSENDVDGFCGECYVNRGFLSGRNNAVYLNIAILRFRSSQAVQIGWTVSAYGGSNVYSLSDLIGYNDIGSTITPIYYEGGSGQLMPISVPIPTTPADIMPGSSIGGTNEPVYWNGTQFTPADQYPTVPSSIADLMPSTTIGGEYTPVYWNGTGFVQTTVPIPANSDGIVPIDKGGTGIAASTTTWYTNTDTHPRFICYFNPLNYVFTCTYNGPMDGISDVASALASPAVQMALRSEVPVLVQGTSTVLYNGTIVTDAMNSHPETIYVLFPDAVQFVLTITNGIHGTLTYSSNSLYLSNISINSPYYWSHASALVGYGLGDYPQGDDTHPVYWTGSQLTPVANAVFTSVTYDSLSTVTAYASGGDVSQTAFTSSPAFVVAEGTITASSAYVSGGAVSQTSFVDTTVVDGLSGGGTSVVVSVS